MVLVEVVGVVGDNAVVALLSVLVLPVLACESDGFGLRGEFEFGKGDGGGRTGGRKVLLFSDGASGDGFDGSCSCEEDGQLVRRKRSTAVKKRSPEEEETIRTFHGGKGGRVGRGGVCVMCYSQRKSGVQGNGVTHHRQHPQHPPSPGPSSTPASSASSEAAAKAAVSSRSCDWKEGRTTPLAGAVALVVEEVPTGAPCGRERGQRKRRARRSE